MSWILTLGYVLDALVTAGVVGNLIAFLLILITRFNPLRIALWTLLVVNGLLLLVSVVIGSRVDPNFKLAPVLVGYVVSLFLFVCLDVGQRRVHCRGDLNSPHQIIYQRILMRRLILAVFSVALRTVHPRFVCFGQLILTSRPPPRAARICASLCVAIAARPGQCPGLPCGNRDGPVVHTGYGLRGSPRKTPRPETAFACHRMKHLRAVLVIRLSEER